MCVRVCVRARACWGTCVCVQNLCICVFVSASARACMCACVREREREVEGGRGRVCVHVCKCFLLRSNTVALYENEIWLRSLNVLVRAAVCNEFLYKDSVFAKWLVGECLLFTLILCVDWQVCCYCQGLGRRKNAQLVRFCFLFVLAVSFLLA